MSVAGRRRGGEGSGSRAALGTQQPPGAGGHRHTPVSSAPSFWPLCWVRAPARDLLRVPMVGQVPGDGAVPPHTLLFPSRARMPRSLTLSTCSHTREETGGPSPHRCHLGVPHVWSYTRHTPNHTRLHTHTHVLTVTHAACHVCAQPRCYTRACRVPRVSGVTRAVCNVSDVLAAICACVCVTTCVHAPISHVCAHKLPHECLQCHTHTCTHTISPHTRVETLGDPTGPHSGAGRAPRARGGTGGSAAAWPRG